MGARAALRLAALLLSLWTAARPARAEEPDAEASARAHFEQGVEAVQHGELTRAAEQFEAAQKLSPNPVVLYNLGQTYTALGRPVEAERALRSYLSAELRPTEPARVKEVEELIEFNARRVGTVVVELDPADAMLQIDGSSAELTAPGRVRLAGGRHVLVATRAAHQPAIANVDVAAGVELRVALVLEPLAPTGAGAPSSRVPTDKSTAASPTEAAARASSHAQDTPPAGLSTQRIVGVTALGVGGLAVVVSAVFALEASGLNRASKRDGHCDGSGCDPTGLPLRAAAVRDGNWATGWLVGGAVMGAVGLALYWLAPTGPPVKKSAARRLSKGADETRLADLTLELHF